MEITVTDNPDEQRYEAYVNKALAGFVTYRRRPDGIALVHTEVLPEAGGKGVGSALARESIEDIRRQGAKVIPVCPFIVTFIRSHPEYLDLVVDRHRAEVTKGGAPA